MLDVSASTTLTHLLCDGNQLNALSLGTSKGLYYLDCSNNQLPTLDISDCSDLVDAYLHGERTYYSGGLVEYVLDYKYLYVDDIVTIIAS